MAFLTSSSIALFIIAQGEGAFLSPLLILVLLFVVFYFFIIRPQKKRDEQRRSMIAAVKKGDRIVTIGGIHGTVTKVEEEDVLVEVDEQVKLRFRKDAINAVGKT